MFRHFRHFVRHLFRHFKPSNGGASTLPTLLHAKPSRARARIHETLFFSVGSVGSVGNTNNTMKFIDKNIRHLFRHFEHGVFKSVGAIDQHKSEVTHG